MTTIRRRTTVVVAACGLAFPVFASIGGAEAASVTGHRATADPATPPISLKMPSSIKAYTEDGSVYLENGPSIIANGEPFELRAVRPSWDQPITLTWMRSTGAVELPADTMTDFGGGLQDFFNVSVRDHQQRRKGRTYLPYCPDQSARAVPDAPAHSGYPSGCPYNPFTIGSVMGLQQGWSTSSWYGLDLPLKPGRYAMNVWITPKYRALFGLTPEQGHSVTTVNVVKPSKNDRGYQLARKKALTVDRATRAGGGSSNQNATKAPRPADHRPAGAALKGFDGPQPDLRSLPAMGMGISPSGNYLTFSATVWNGGTSPLVVDGFRRDGEDLMDAYQYFFDKAGNQVGYQPVGEMEWDARPSHQHWHFEDFAKYELLNADKSLARRSSKEAFCLANTDAVDYTLPAADWNPDGTDLSTACGDYNSSSVREALAVGSGDTYSQIRAGQSFNLKGLPNGTYYIAVTANPEGNLAESDTGNNVSYREVRIGGKTGHRTVKSSPVGLVDDSGWFQDW